jgi:hypothetical protein
MRLSWEERPRKHILKCEDSIQVILHKEDVKVYNTLHSAGSGRDFVTTQ